GRAVPDLRRDRRRLRQALPAQEGRQAGGRRPEAVGARRRGSGRRPAAPAVGGERGMCGLCGALGGAGDWTEAGGAAAGATRRAGRLARASLANAVLRHYGLGLSDWQGARYVLRKATGGSEIVDSLG